MKKLWIILGVVFLIAASFLMGHFTALPNEATSNLTLENYPQNATFTYLDVSNGVNGYDNNLLIRYYDNNKTFLKEYNLTPTPSRFYRVKTWQTNNQSIVVISEKSKSSLGADISSVALLLVGAGMITWAIRENRRYKRH